MNTGEPAFLDVALIRLRHLAQQQEEPVADAVRRLVAHPGNHGKVLAEVVAWIDDPDPERQHTGLRCFQDLLGTPSCITEDIRPSLIVGWRALLRQTTIDRIEPTVTAWLHSAATHPQQRTTMLDILVRAAAGHVGTFVMVNLIRHYWTIGRTGTATIDPELRQDVGGELSTKLDEHDPILPTLALSDHTSEQ